MPPGRRGPNRGDDPRRGAETVCDFKGLSGAGAASNKHAKKLEYNTNYEVDFSSPPKHTPTPGRCRVGDLGRAHILPHVRVTLWCDSLSRRSRL
ncbi:hypothetical protein GCM10007904_14160 [Oharaeibacter diazotrophicus]|nr:hypothetical protein GCM10007904_14160 [Oharaeibacter diazotrophicus]